MTEELRDRLRYLRHLPLAQAFEVLLIVLAPVGSFDCPRRFIFQKLLDGVKTT
jgi:hypothetical protein